MTASLPRVVVATLTWNHQEDVFRCVDSLLEIDYPNFEILVVDHASTDGTFQALRKKYPEISVIRHRENFGFGEGINGQVRYAIEHKADYLLSVDNDATVAPLTLRKMVDVAVTDPKIGMVFPKVFYQDSKTVWYGQGTPVENIDWEKGLFPGLESEQGVLSKKPIRTDIFPGGFSLVNIKAVKEVGYLNPDYYIYYDDADWFYRLHEAGYHGFLVPEAHMWHKPASTIGLNSEAYHYYQTRNRLYFFKNHSNPQTFKIFFRSYLFESLMEGARLLRKGKKNHLRGLVSGWIDFLRGKKRNKSFGVKKTGLPVRLIGKLTRPVVKFWRKFLFSCKLQVGKEVRVRVYIDWNIGDEIMAMPVFEALKQKYRNSHISADMRFPALLENHPFVDEVNPEQEEWHDLYIDLHQDIRKRPRNDYLPEIAGVSIWPNPKIYLSQDEIDAVCEKWPLRSDRLRIAVNPEVWWLARRWPRDRWIEVSRHFAEKHDADIFVLGTEADPLPLGHNLIGQTTLREATAVFSQCHLFLGHDSGPLYMALAVGTPSVGLYGPLNPYYLYPPQKTFIPLWTDVECKGCWPDERMKLRDHCPKIVPDCLPDIRVEQVIEAGEKLLNQSQKAGVLRP